MNRPARPPKHRTLNGSAVAARVRSLVVSFSQRRFTWSSLTLILSLVSTANSDEFTYFETHVRPLLTERCLECHAAESESIGGNLHLDSRDGWTRGGDLGPAIRPGNPEESLLIQAVRHTHADLQMPPDGKLADRDVQILETWIRSGAPDPRDEKLALQTRSIDVNEGRGHWAFQPLTDVKPPRTSVQRRTWALNDIDWFILAELERHELHPVQAADRATLIRRATYDLTGLPPTPEEVQAFLSNDSPAAYEQLIDRLLASPRYGERWGRFWLDVARYADSNGLDENIAHGNAWRYRDYVFASFNGDKPFDQFVMEQLAGDLMPATSDEELRRERRVATGFLSLGPKVLAEVDETKMEMDIVDEQVDTVGRAFLGLTLGCARCHDHKFDPIRTEDYYALAGIFKSTKTMEHFTKIARWQELEIATAAQRTRHHDQQQRIDAIKAEIEHLENVKQDEAGGSDTKTVAVSSNASPSSLEALQTQLARLQKELPELPTAMAVTDSENPKDVPVHIRGSHLTLGDMVPRGFPQVLQSDETSDFVIAQDESGRRQLAEWLTGNRHPLTARVITNRLWRWHFGRGIVQSTDNFGLLGTEPVNQPLLDWLAIQLIHDGWSIKSMHRRLMLSATYRMSSAYDPTNAAVDPDNRYQWRSNIRRLEAEAVRDSVLAVSGILDLSMGGSLLHVKNREFLFDHTSKDQTKYDSPRRSVYLPVIRNHLYDAFQIFDYSDASVMNSNRETTTVAPQALFMMNSPLVTHAAKSFAQRICDTVAAEDERIQLAYQIAFGRSPSDHEIVQTEQFLAELRHNIDMLDDAAQADQRVWTVLGQVLMMSNEFIHVR